jgi:hypothetical protein
VKYAAIAIAAVTLAGCSVTPSSMEDRFTLEAAAGVNVSKYMPWSSNLDGGFDGPTDTVRFTVRYEINRISFCSLTHISHLSAGWPVNDKPEDWLDIAECGARVRL